MSVLLFIILANSYIERDLAGALKALWRITSSLTENRFLSNTLIFAVISFRW